MNLYEINSSIEEIIEKSYQFAAEHDGEMSEDFLSELDNLKLLRTDKIENICFAIKNAKANSEIISSEIKILQQKKQYSENLQERFKNYLASVLNGEKVKTALNSVYYKDTVSVSVDETITPPDRFARIKKEWDKIMLKEALQAGENIEGCKLVNKTSIVVR